MGFVKKMGMKDSPSNCDESIPRKKRSLVEYLIEKFKKKPVTKEEIEQLKLQREAAYIKKDIAKTNSETKELKHKNDFIGLFTKNTTTKTPKF